MQPPVAIDTLLQQAVWVDWHDEQLHWDRTCDSCGQDLQPAQVRHSAVRSGWLLCVVVACVQARLICIVNVDQSVWLV
jgi:hypothetical protein